VLKKKETLGLAAFQNGLRAHQSKRAAKINQKWAAAKE